MPVVVSRFHTINTRNYDRTRIVLNRLAAIRNAEGEDQDAEIIWGQKTNFSLITPDGGNAGLQIDRPDDPSCDEDSTFARWGVYGSCEQQPETKQWDEIKREEEIVRIENPDDPDQYVMVARINSIIFSAPNGEHHKFNYTHPAVA